MDRLTFEWLHQKWYPYLMDDCGDVIVGRIRVDPIKELHVAIWTLANPESFR